MVPRLLHICLFAVTGLILLTLTSCYTLATEPEFVRGKISDQPESTRKATLIPAETFMAEYNNLYSVYGRKNFKIPVGTKLVFSITNQKELDTTIAVGPDGQVDLPLIGTVHVAGKFLDDLRSELRDRYTPFFKKDVSINLNTEMRTIGYFGGNGGIAGKATVIIADDGLNGREVYLDGDEELTDVLFSSGSYGGRERLGIKPEWKEIGIIRKVQMEDQATQETIIILCDLEKVLFSGDLKQNVPIKHKDIVFVPRRRDSLLEELRDSLSFWAGMFSDAQQIRDVIKAMEGW